MISWRHRRYLSNLLEPIMSNGDLIGVPIPKIIQCLPTRAHTHTHTHLALHVAVWHFCASHGWFIALGLQKDTPHRVLHYVGHGR